MNDADLIYRLRNGRLHVERGACINDLLKFHLGAADHIAALTTTCRALMAFIECGGAKWRPIATAPKDGSDIDLYGFPLWTSTEAVRIPDCHFYMGEWLYWRSDPEPEWAPVWNPTHWMPLPAPPGVPVTLDDDARAVVDAARKILGES